MFVSKKVEIKETNKGKGIFANKKIGKYERILEFEKNFVTKPSNFTLRIAENIHQISKDPCAKENFVNHSCEPNAYINFKDLSLKALRNIKPDEEIAYNYLTVDWDDEDIFECKCRAKNCYKNLHGFKNLSFKEKIKLRQFLSPFLSKKIKENKSADRSC